MAMTEPDDNSPADDEQVTSGTGEPDGELVPFTSDEADEDDGRKMPFLDHLEEFRWRILKALGAVLVGAIIAFTVSEQLLRILNDAAMQALMKIEGFRNLNQEIETIINKSADRIDPISVTIPTR